MQLRSVLIVGGNEPFRSVATEAAHRAYPDVNVRLFATLAEARQAPWDSGPALLVLESPTPADARAAHEAADETRLPRWALLICGEELSLPGILCLSQGEWRVPEVARGYRCTLQLHGLRRENARNRGDFASFGVRIAHDLRTPLGCILTSAETLQESLPAEAALARPIIECAADLGKLIQQMSLVAKASGDPPPAAQFNMETAVAAALTRLESRILRQEARVQQAPIWPKVVGDRTWTEAMWWNLLDNALRYAGPKPDIELGWAEEGTSRRFWVADRGAGVSAEKVPTLFHPFHRLHESNAARGLGLPIVRRLAELQGGNCRYEPRIGGGSAFSFTQPGAA